MFQAGRVGSWLEYLYNKREEMAALETDKEEVNGGW